MIIGLAGKKGSGKDTVADYLCEQYGFVKYGFGDPIKEIGRIMFDFNSEQLYGSEKEIVDSNWGITPREFFQKFGTEYGQFILPTHFPNLFQDINERQFWVKRFWVWYSKELEKNPNLKVVVSDIRFMHEFNFIKEKEGYVLKIERDLTKKDSHISENELDEISLGEYNCILYNNGSKEELFQKVKDILN